MKIHHFIAPALALVVAAWWLAHQNEIIEELTEKSRIISERIVDNENSNSRNDSPLFVISEENGPHNLTLSDGSHDWELIAKAMAENNRNEGFPSNVRTMLKLEQIIMQLTEAEIAEGLDAIPNLDLEPLTANLLRYGLISMLAEKKPLAAMQALDGVVIDDSTDLYWSFANITSEAARENPMAVAAWLDKQVADGIFETTALGRDQDVRLQHEGALFPYLLASNYEAAKSRLTPYSTKEKASILSSCKQQFPGKAIVKFLELARENLPPDQASSIITGVFANIHHQKISEIGNSIKDIPFTESERAQVIDQLVTNFTRTSVSESKFEDIHQWSKTEASGREAELVGKALATAGERGNANQESFEKALSVSAELGDPAILTIFVEHFSRDCNETAVADQIESFDDPTLAEKYRTLVEALPSKNADSESR